MAKRLIILVAMQLLSSCVSTPTARVLLNASASTPLNLTSLGVSVLWKRTDVDISHGIKQFNCGHNCLWNGTNQATNISVRTYLTHTRRLFLTYQHTSDIFVSSPEVTVDFIGVGISSRVSKKIWIDVSGGNAALNCRFNKRIMCFKDNLGIQLTTRGYPFQK